MSKSRMNHTLCPAQLIRKLTTTHICVAQGFGHRTFCPVQLIREQVAGHVRFTYCFEHHVSGTIRIITLTIFPFEHLCRCGCTCHSIVKKGTSCQTFAITHFPFSFRFFGPGSHYSRLSPIQNYRFIEQFECQLRFCNTIFFNYSEIKDNVAHMVLRHARYRNDGRDAPGHRNRSKNEFRPAIIAIKYCYINKF